MFTIANAREISLIKFGGLYLESDPRSLPPGASPQTWDTDFLIASVGTRPGLTNPVTSFLPSLPSLPVTYLRSTEVLGPANLTLLEDNGTTLYEENLNSPGTFASIYGNIINSSRAISDTVNQREYLGLSNLIYGTDQPRQYDGTNLDRISQVAPGAGPGVIVTSPSYGITSITEIYSTVGIDSVSWGANINLDNAGPPSTNLYFLGTAGATDFTTGLEIGNIVYVSGLGNLEGQNPNGTYAVTSIGSFTDTHGTFQYFGVTATVSNADFVRTGAGGTYQLTSALVQLSTPIPSQSAAVGGKIAIQGASVSQWNTDWTILDTPTEGQLSIDSTSLTSNVATYGYTLQTGETPGWQPNYNYPIAAQIVDPSGNVWQITTPGLSASSDSGYWGSSPQTDNDAVWTKLTGVQVLVTVFNTNNGNGIFNIQNQPITSATSTTFTVAITSPNISPAVEDANAVSGSGTTLIIDPGTITLGTGNPGTDPIYGDATGGDVLVLNPLVAAGQRYAVEMFLTRNGYITPASPPVSFFTTGASGTFTFNNMCIGPPNVIARIVAITLANAGIGGPYFWIPDNVIVLGSAASLGVSQTFQQTVIEDNVSTNLGPITLSDAVLAASENISVEGNNLQQQRELCEMAKPIQYAGRCFYLGEVTQNTSFLNTTFDGGEINLLPAGWSVTPSLAPIISVIPSPIVNTSCYIDNSPSPQVVQSASSLNVHQATITVVLPASPTVGNSLIFILSGYNGGTAYPTQTGLTSRASEAGSIYSSRIYTRTIVSGDTATWTLNVNASPVGVSSLTIYEVSKTPTFTGAAGTGTASASTIATGTITPSGETMVFAAFTYSLTSFAAQSIAPNSAYYLIQNTASLAYASGFSIGFAQGAAIPTSAVTLTLTEASLLQPIYATLVCEFSGTFGATVNPISTSLADIISLNQPAYQNTFNSPVTDQNTAYSVRVTAAIPSGNTGGTLYVELYSPSLATNWAFTVPFSSMTTKIKEFIGALSNPLWQSVPSDLQLRVYPYNMLAGADLLIDRIEIFPSQQPVYTTQVAASYLENTEAIDGVTGAIDTGLLSSQTQTNHFLFLNKYYITTKRQAGRSQTLSPIRSASEPSSWSVEEISNTVGSVGPLAADVGEEYVLVADDDGGYIFDGGNHIKITQEIQPIWDAIYAPSKSTIWVKNDKRQQRFLFGVPLPTPNQWLPNAPANATPVTPNVILMCSYLSLMTGAEIAAGIAVHVSPFSGNLLFHDGRRKWTIWQIPAATGEWIDRADGSEEIWFGQAGNGVSALDSTIATDNGSAIVPRYVTYAFANELDREKLQLTQGRVLYPYMLANIEGTGRWELTLWPETLGTPVNPNPYPFTQAPFTLANPALDDVNAPLNVTGNRAFVQIDSDGVAGTTWSIKRIDMGIMDDPRMRISGR